MMHWTRYRQGSGACDACGGPANVYARLVAARRAADCDLLPCAVRPAQHWIDHAAVEQLRADHAAAVASWRDLADSSPPPLEPDWSQAVRDKTPNPAELVGSAEGRLAVDLLAAPEIVIDSIPPWSTLRITGPVGAEQSYDDGTDAERIRLYVPGQYRVALAASRHLAREWVINAT